jgi:hypothetical protein
VYDFARRRRAADAFIASSPWDGRCVENLRRGHYELGVDASPAQRVDAAFTELAQAI